MEAYPALTAVHVVSLPICPGLLLFAELEEPKEPLVFCPQVHKVPSFLTAPTGQYSALICAQLLFVPICIKLERFVVLFSPNSPVAFAPTDQIVPSVLSAIANLLQDTAMLSQLVSNPT